MSFPSMGLLLLPDDVLLEILGLLTAFEVSLCSLTCRRLRGLSLTPAVWLKISGNGNYGYMAFLPQRVTKLISHTSMYQRHLSRAELSERQWAGFIPRQRPGMYRLGMCPLGHYPRGFMGKCYVDHHQTPIGDAVFRWYPMPGADATATRELKPIYTFTLQYDEKYRPQFPPLPYYYKFCCNDDTFVITYARQEEGDSKTMIYFIEIRAVERDFQTPSQLSVALPFPLIHGIIRWLDDNHILVIDLDEVADRSTLIVERRTGNMINIPQLRLYQSNTTSADDQIAQKMDIITNSLQFFVTPSYCVQVLQRCHYYEIFELPRHTESNVDGTRETVLHAKRTQHAGQSSCKLYNIWHVQEHTSALTIVGVTSTSVSSQIALLRWSLANSVIEEFMLPHKFEGNLQCRLISTNPHPSSGSLLAVAAHSQLDYWSESMVSLILIRVTFGSALEYPDVYVVQPGSAPGPESMPRIFEAPNINEIWDYGWIDKHRGQFGVCCTRDGTGIIWTTTLL